MSKCLPCDCFCCVNVSCMSASAMCHGALDSLGTTVQRWHDWRSRLHLARHGTAAGLDFSHGFQTPDAMHKSICFPRITQCIRLYGFKYLVRTVRGNESMHVFCVIVLRGCRLHNLLNALPTLASIIRSQWMAIRWNTKKRRRKIVRQRHVLRLLYNHLCA